MIPSELSQLLMLYTWFALAALLFFLLLIARFYQRFASERTFFRWFIFPAAVYGLATIRYASIDQVAGDGIGALLMGAAGISLAALSALVYRRMTVGRASVPVQPLDPPFHD
ncbi:MAG: hypothetical protein SF162_17805 [bacterium]|nr:hypothetical protein [bacterium]